MTSESSEFEGTFEQERWKAIEAFAEKRDLIKNKAGLARELLPLEGGLREAELRTKYVVQHNEKSLNYIPDYYEAVMYQKWLEFEIAFLKSKFDKGAYAAFMGRLETSVLHIPEADLEEMGYDFHHAFYREVGRRYRLLPSEG